MTDSEATRLRWAGQRIDAVAAGTLPGLARVSNLVQSVRSPEFQGVTFHEVLAKTALNHVPADARMLPDEWTINPYRGCTHACAYCYARPTHDHLGLDILGDFETQIIVKTNVVDVLRAELKKKRALPSRVALGTSTDPYQRAEGRYRLMPGIITALGESGVPLSVLTKGTLIRRDIPLLAEADRRAHVEPGLSISLVDEELQRSLEPGTPSTAARLATVSELRAAGLECTVFISPILPLLSDRPEQLDRMVRSVAEAGATSVLYTALYLSSRVRPGFFAWLGRAHPELVPDYQRIYSAGSNADPRYLTWLDDQMIPLLQRYGLPLPDAGVEDKFALNGKRSAPSNEPPAPTLF
ncbi:radical SAM protein [Herbiconiux sp. UC225_62]|uniref:radical SAM protein n=1 Tax=Herbiconiux sp. UC225_62 TaxID=3350168 RepID=UPI0036D24F64